MQMLQKYSFKAFHDDMCSTIKELQALSHLLLLFFFLGTGIIFLVLQMLGIEEIDKDRLNINMTQL